MLGWNPHEKLTAKNVATVLRRMAEQCEDDEADAAIYAEVTERMLDDLLNADFFGTEGQCDPRGDHRG
jgi:hypothetical protein